MAPRRPLSPAIAPDPEAARIANMRRRAAALERHARAKGPDGKSTLAVAAGRAGGRKTADRLGCPSAWGLRLALRRWHGVGLPQKGAGA